METEKAKNVKFNPLDITESLGYTTFRRDSRKPWTKEEDVELAALVDGKLRDLGLPDGIQSLTTPQWAAQTSQLVQDINWEDISDKLRTRKSKDCRKRWTNSLDPNLKKGKWTAEEDEMLIASFAKHGSSWQKISLEIPGRTDDQCAKRYIEVLDPNTKDRLRAWSLEEDLSLIKKVKAYGTKWRTISSEMKSRPSLTCRNRWRKLVTEVVRGKANEQIKIEIDSMEGGLSKLEEISETLHNQKKEILREKEKVKKEKQKTAASSSSTTTTTQSHEPVMARIPSLTQHNTPTPYISSSSHTSNRPLSNMNPLQQIQASLTDAASPSYVESPKPSSTDTDWKYTLKDTSGLTLSNGNISNAELAKNLIENAKKYNLKISIHQHIHHHYAPTNITSKMGSPEDSTSNLSGNNVSETDLIQPNRYSHFNYLPPMVQPQLESSNLGNRENDLTRILNPSTSSHHYQTASSKRRLSNSSNNSRKKHAPIPLNQQHSSQGVGQHRQANLADHHSNPFNHEDLEDELDFWETMRSLSQVVNNDDDDDDLTSTKKPPKGQQAQPTKRHPLQRPRRKSDEQPQEGKKPTELGLYYNTFTEEDDLDLEELEDNLKDLGGFANGLPFNPS